MTQTLGNTVLRCPAPAKINLFLHVTGRRADGYHLLQTAFRLLDHGDTITLRLRDDGQITRSSDLPGVPAEQDLVVRAARLLQAHSGCPLGVDIHVEKQLPMGGGLGGGSSDAASVLLGLNRLWSLNLPRQSLQDLGLALGADVPFFIYGRGAIAEGVGETLQPLALQPAWYVVIEPPVSVPTQEIFCAEDLTRDTKPIIILGSLVGPQDKSLEKRSGKNEGMIEAEVVGGDVCFLMDQERIEQDTRNDLQPVACRRYPQIVQALDALQGFARPAAGKPRMSGSGACVFLPCADREHAHQVAAALSPEWRVWCAAALDEHPLRGFAD